MCICGNDGEWIAWVAPPPNSFGVRTCPDIDMTEAAML